MTRDEARKEIRNNWKYFYPKDKSGKGIICPLCGSGSGTHGTGISSYKKANKPYHLECWNCSFKGDVIDLYQQDKGVDHNQALKEMADILGITIDKYTPQDAKFATKEPIKTNKGINDRAEAKRANTGDYTAYYKQCEINLEQSKEAQAYITGRGISMETAREYHLGFDSRCDITGKGHIEPRIICPVTKEYYIGRSILQNSNYPKMQKGSPIIFNGSNADAKGALFVVEGFFDALSILETGHNAIATNSTSNVLRVIELLNDCKHKDKMYIFICLDNDGNKGTELAGNKLADGLNDIEIPFSFADITGEYKDANEALQANRADFEKRLEDAEEMADDYYFWKNINPDDLDFNDFDFDDLELDEPTTDTAAGEEEKDQSQKEYEQAIDDFFAMIQTEAFKPYKTGLGFFDDILGGGIIKQTLNLIMAAPGAGKTTLCQQIAEAMAENKQKVIFLNLEMPSTQLFAKALSYKVADKYKVFMSAKEILQGYSWSEKEREAVTAAVADYKRSTAPYLQYNPKQFTADLDNIIMNLRTIGEEAKKNGEDAPIVFLDYLHLISSQRGLDERELIKQAVLALKNYAKDYNTSVIAVSATNRDSYGRITISSGRDSSNIEYTADNIISLNYEDIDSGKIKEPTAEEMAKLILEEPRRMTLRVLKGRLTAPGKAAHLYFDAKNNFFYGNQEFVPGDYAMYFGKENEEEIEII